MANKDSKKEKKMRLNRDEISAEETLGVREEPDLQSDKFGDDEATKIVKMVMLDVETGYNAQKEWLEIKKKEVQHIHGEKPSVIQNLKKRDWMSDINLNLMAGIHDIFQATILSTCYNPNSLHFFPTEEGDVDNRDNLAKFAKWGLSESEADFFPEVDDFIQNRVAHGFSCFKVYWEVRYQWVDKRIPVYSSKNDNVVIGYKVEPENRRFERGVIKNLDNIDDVLMPAYGNKIDDLPFFIEVMHLTFNDLLDMDDMGMLENFDAKEMKDKFKSNINHISADDIRHKKLEITKLKEVDSENLTNTVLDLYLWHGEYEKDGKREKYQMMIEPISETFLFGKPVRKLNRSGRMPYVGGPLRGTPGMLRGGSLTMLIANLVNALNNNYNQTSDYQYAENLPWGIANLTELGLSGAKQELEPGILLDSDAENVKDKVFFPNLSRSLAWSYQDKDFLLAMIERLTGAASYFLTSDAKKQTATHDAIVDEKSDTKFGLWVKRMMVDICQAVNMWLELYQDNAPVTLGERVLGEDGKKLFKNLSIDDLRGRYDTKMIPDITHGSKAYEQKLAMWGLQLSMSNPWFNPELNARGSWKITSEAMKKMGYQDIEEYLPPQPKEKMGTGKEVEEEFTKMKQGDVFNPPPEGVTPLAMEHYEGHMRQKEEKYNEIPEEYRPTFDAHIHATYRNMMDFVAKKKNEQMAERVAMRAGKMIEGAATPAREGGPMAQNQAQRPQQGQGGMMSPQNPNVPPEGDIAL